MNNIKELREMTGQTQREFAENFGIPLGTLRRWEYGESKPAPYIIKFIEEKIPMNRENLEEIKSMYGTYYYDNISKTVEDKKGTKIFVNIDFEGVNKNNLAIYINTLFETYYEAIERFQSDCEIDKTEDIIWG